MKLVGALIILCVIGCEPAPCEQRWGYFVEESPHYQLSDVKITPGGVQYDGSGQEISVELLDRSTNEVESCLERSVDRKSFQVKIASDWTLSCTSGDQVLPMVTPDRFCKGQQATSECPCRYRAIIQCPNTIVTTPNMLLYKDALTRFLTRSQNPWEGTFATCATPSL